MSEEQSDLVNKVSQACDGHLESDILAVMSAIIASIIDEMDLDKGVPLALSVAMNAIELAYDIEADLTNMSEYLQ